MRQCVRIAAITGKFFVFWLATHVFEFVVHKGGWQCIFCRQINESRWTAVTKRNAHGVAKWGSLRVIAWNGSVAVTIRIAEPVFLHVLVKIIAIAGTRDAVMVIVLVGPVVAAACRAVAKWHKTLPLRAAQCASYKRVAMPVLRALVLKRREKTARAIFAAVRVLIGRGKVAAVVVV